ncbi:hypothetical protein VL20_2047 [Microcystis panniformis FACHB-1757]|uniref:Uncharacterized protein n=1 Tax=Microcystis panniformis FACHB-1757 TaxID=1638788 RepID=A0A0K1RZP1_9CHRO|nr:hypothetical protein VL20_2047 [Microcystis panniformis FACHB-1757]
MKFPHFPTSPHPTPHFPTSSPPHFPISPHPTPHFPNLFPDKTLVIVKTLG